MVRISEQVARPVRLHLLASVLDDDPIGSFRHDPHVVGYEHEPHAVVAAQPHQKVENLRLDGYVERGRRLVGDQDLGPACERHRDHHPLAHAAGKLVGKGAGAALRIGNADFGQKLDDPLATLSAIQAKVRLQRFTDLKANREAGIERRHWLLENHRHVLTGDATPFGGAIDRRSAPAKAKRSATTIAAGGRSPIAASIATDLPEPDSPTIASTSFRSSVKSNPSTALNGPCRVGKETVRLRISSRGTGGLAER